MSAALISAGGPQSFAAHYPAWRYSYNIEAILTEMYDANRQRWVSR